MLKIVGGHGHLATPVVDGGFWTR